MQHNYTPPQSRVYRFQAQRKQPTNENLKTRNNKTFKKKVKNDKSRCRSCGAPYMRINPSGVGWMTLCSNSKVSPKF